MTMPPMKNVPSKVTMPPMKNVPSKVGKIRSIPREDPDFRKIPSKDSALDK
jgi:hypothetical protein